MDSNLPQTEMQNIISYWNRSMKFVKFKSGRDMQNLTRVVQLLKCGRKRIVWDFPSLPKSSKNRNVKDYFMFECISEMWMKK